MRDSFPSDDNYFGPEHGKGNRGSLSRLTSNHSRCVDALNWIEIFRFLHRRFRWVRSSPVQRPKGHRRRLTSGVAVGQRADKFARILSFGFDRRRCYWNDRDPVSPSQFDSLQIHEHCDDRAKTIADVAINRVFIVTLLTFACSTAYTSCRCRKGRGRCGRLWGPCCGSARASCPIPCQRSRLAVAVRFRSPAGHLP